MTRPVALASALGLHVGILLLMRVGLFSYAMAACLCLFVPPRWLGGPVAAEPLPRAGRPWGRVVGVALSLQLACVILSLLRVHLPSLIARELTFFRLTQSWTMFAPNPPGSDVYWRATASLPEGRTVDALAGAPELRPHSVLRFSRWDKISDSMIADSSVQVLVSKYLCRRLAAESPLDVHLQLWTRPLRQPGEAAHAFVLGFDRVLRCRS